MIWTGGDVIFGKNFTIVDYYNRYVQQFQNNGQFAVPSEIIQGGGKWTFKNPKSYWRNVNITVDIKNGYIDASYDDDPPGTQGRSIKIACAVFFKADTSAFLAINTIKTQMLPEPDLRIYSFNNGVLADVTKTVLPKVNYRSFLDEKFDQGKLNRFKENDWAAARVIDYDIPRYGTTIKASIIMDHIDDIFIRDKGAPEKERDQAISGIKENLKYINIEITWNMKAGKFEISKKTR
jgi:hypothetical protein